MVLMIFDENLQRASSQVRHRYSLIIRRREDQVVVYCNFRHYMRMMLDRKLANSIRDSPYFDRPVSGGSDCLGLLFLLVEPEIAAANVSFVAFQNPLRFTS